MPFVYVMDGGVQTFAYDTTAEQNVTVATSQTSRGNALTALEAAQNLLSAMNNAMTSSGAGSSSTSSTTTSTPPASGS